MKKIFLVYIVCAFVAVVFLFQVLAPKQEPVGDKVITLMGKQFIVPRSVLATRFVFAGLTAPLSFRLNAETLEVPSENVSDLSVDEENNYITVQLLGLSIDGGKNTQASYQRRAKESKPTDCKKYTFDKKAYDLCHYDPIKNEMESHRMLIQKDSQKVICNMSCTDTPVWIPPNPLCMADDVIFDDIELAYRFSTRYANRAAEICYAVHQKVQSFYNSGER